MTKYKEALPEEQKEKERRKSLGLAGMVVSLALGTGGVSTLVNLSNENPPYTKEELTTKNLPSIDKNHYKEYASLGALLATVAGFSGLICSLGYYFDDGKAVDKESALYQMVRLFT